MMYPRTEVRTTFPQCAAVSALAATLTALTVWMFSAASALAVVAG